VLGQWGPGHQPWRRPGDAQQGHIAPGSEASPRHASTTLAMEDPARATQATVGPHLTSFSAAIAQLDVSLRMLGGGRSRSVGSLPEHSAVTSGSMGWGLASAADGGLCGWEHAAASRLEAGVVGGYLLGPGKVLGAHPGTAPARYVPFPFRSHGFWRSEPPWVGAAKHCIIADPTRLVPSPSLLNLPVARSPICFREGPYILLRTSLERNSHPSVLSWPSLKDARWASSCREPLKEPALFTFLLNGFAFYSSSHSVLCSLNIAPDCCCPRPFQEPCVYYLTRCLSARVVVCLLWHWTSAFLKFTSKKLWPSVVLCALRPRFLTLPLLSVVSCRSWPPFACSLRGRGSAATSLHGRTGHHSSGKD
jgi:hypothetical protein